MKKELAFEQDGDGRYQKNYSDAIENRQTSVALAFMLSEVTGKKVVELDSINDCIDTDCLDSLFLKNQTLNCHEGIEVSFQTNGFDVSISSCGDIVLQKVE